MQKYHPYSTNFRLTRRQFLLSVTGLLWGVFWLLTCRQLLPTGWAKKLPNLKESPPFWWVHLPSGKLTGNSAALPPMGEAGSLNKLILTAALLEENLLSPQTRYTCEGEKIVDGVTYRCQKRHGSLSLEKALGYSCNLFFVQASAALSIETFLAYARKFRLDQPVFEEIAFQFPKTDEEIRQRPPQVLFLGMSPAFQPNLLQILRVSSLIATRGKAPAFQSERFAHTNSAPPKPLQLQERTWNLLQAGMILAGRYGTAQKLDPNQQLHLAVKTGTTPHGSSFDSWITGYFPTDNPKYAFALRALNGTSIDKAVPLARQALFSRKWP